MHASRAARRELVLLAGAAFVLAGVVVVGTGCATRPADRGPRLRGTVRSAAVPRAVSRTQAGRELVSTTSTPTGPYTVGLGIAGPATRSVDETVTVVAWISSKSKRKRLLHGDMYEGVLNVVVLNNEGFKVYDDLEHNTRLPTGELRRGGGPTVAELGGGIVFQRKVSLKLDVPGSYRVIGIARFGIRKLSASSNQLRSEDFDNYEATTDPLALRLKP